jgi:hypothetical protein
MDDTQVIVTSKGKLVCAERDKMLVFPKSGEATDNFLVRAAKELDMRARNTDSVMSLPI